jgi:hypothetical protein
MTFDNEILSEKNLSHLLMFGENSYAIKTLEFDSDAL